MLRIFLLSVLLSGAFSSPAGQSVVLKDDGSYHFSFDTGDDADAGQHAREEVRQPDGTVIGKYSYKDDTGALRSVSYRAGRQGFIASGDVGAVGSPPGQVPAKIPEIPPEVPVTTPHPVHEEHYVSSSPVTESPTPSSESPKIETDDEEAHAPPVNPSEEEVPFPAPPFGKRRLGDEPVKPDEKDPVSAVDPSSYFYSFGHSYGPQYFSKPQGPQTQVSFGHGAPAVQPYYNPNYVKNPSHPFYAPGTVSGLTNHAFYAPGTSAPQAPVWNYVPQQQEQPAVKANSQGEHPGVFDVPPYWKRRLQDPNEAKEEDEDRSKDDVSGDIGPNKFSSGSPIYPTLTRTSFVPHSDPVEKKPVQTVAPKRKVISRFFIYVPTTPQSIPYWGYEPSGMKGTQFKYVPAKPADKYTPSYGQDYWSYQPQYMPQNQYSGPWNYMPQSYIPQQQQQAPLSFFSRAVPVSPTPEKKSADPTSYYQEHSRPAVQHYAYKGPSNTYGYFYQY